MECVVAISLIITFVLFIAWVIEGSEGFGIGTVLFLIISLLFLSSVSNSKPADFTVKNCIITDHYDNLYYDHKVAIYPVKVNRKNCFFGDHYIVVYTDPNKTLSVPEICDFLNRKLEN